MRIAIEGNTWPADRLRALVQATDGFTLATSRPAFTIQVGRTTDDRVHVDTPDGPFEQHLFRLLRAAVRRNGNLAGVGLLALDAEGGNQNPKVMSIALPDDFEDTQLEAITRALWIALCTVAQHGDTRPWWERRWPWLFALALLLASPAAGQTNRVTFGGVAQPVTLADNADRLLGAVSFIAPQHIICDSGCSSGGGGGTVDQGAAALAAGAWPFYVTFGGAAIDPRLVTVQNASLAVTGTFWQATQPVSGTVTVNQGTAAGLAAGWPVIIGNANQQTATWDSSTALNTAVSAGTINNYSTLIITARTTTTITAGQMTFQCSDDGSNWFNVQAVRTDSATVDTVYSFVASTNQAWLLYTGAWARCRALVSQQITGTGAATVTFTPSAASGTAMTVNQPAAGTTQTISGAVTATVTDVATATNQTGGGQKTQIVDGSGNVASQTANAIDVNIKSGSIANTGFNVNNTVSATPADGDAGLPTRVVPEVRSSTGTLGALNARVSIAVTGMSSVGGRIDAGTCSCTFSFKISSDGGATYSTGAVIGPLGTQITSLTVNNPNAAGAFEFFPGAQITNVAVDVTSYTSGSTTGTLRASPGISALALGLSNGLPGTSPPLYATQIAGTDGTSLRQLQMKNTANAGTEYAAIVQLSSLGNTVQAAATIADGADATLGAKADAKSTATDTTAISAMSVLKEISAMEQAPASRAVTNAGTFAVQATLQAGAAIAGKFGIDQTTPGTTNGVQVNAALPAGANVIGHVIADSGSTTAVTGNVATTAADASNVTLGAKADAKSTATDTTAVTAMSVLKEISAMEQAPASRAVTNAGTFAVQAAIADAADVTLGAKADAKSTATDTTSVTVMSVLKEISAMEQAPASQAVTNAGTFAVQAAPPTLTKGSQGSTGYSVQNLYDAGRSRVSFTADRVTPAASDTLVTFVKNVAGTATSAQTTYTVTNAKTFRVTSIYVGIANTSTVSANVRVALRENTGGTCTASSAAVAMLQVAAGNIAANEGADGSLAIPDGWEFPAADSVCISAIGVATTETLTVTVLGYEY